MCVKLGSLFDGIGGFPYSASKFGVRAVWASEIETWPIKVTSKHFPAMTHLGDISKIDGAKIEPVDIITFGSPCQDLSVAGKREGLEGARSSLFMEAIRIIREMRCATHGLYPKIIVWENVFGVLSSNRGQDFRQVLREITETEIPMPASGKWGGAGLVRTEHVDLAWRVLDAQHWGVPQRRRRIFLVADFGGQCAGEILFKPESLRRNLTPGRDTREKVAGGAGAGVERTNRINSPSDGIAGTVSSKWAKGTGGPAGDEYYNLVTIPVAAFRAGQGDKAGSIGYEEEISPTLTAAPSGTNQVPVILYDMTHADEVIRPITGGVAPTLNSRMGTGGNQVPVTLAFNGRQDPVCYGDKSGALDTCRPQSQCIVLVSRRAVRRLTPLECLRLQGYPDWWLDFAGMSDTAKYKAIGNSVAIPCVDYVMSGIVETLKIERSNNNGF